MSGLREDRWVITSASAFDLLRNIVVVDVLEENLDSHGNLAGKGKSILIAFSDTVGIFCDATSKFNK